MVCFGFRHQRKRSCFGIKHLVLFGSVTTNTAGKCPDVSLNLPVFVGWTVVSHLAAILPRCHMIVRMSILIFIQRWKSVGPTQSQRLMLAKCVFFVKPQIPQNLTFLYVATHHSHLGSTNQRPTWRQIKGPSTWKHTFIKPGLRVEKLENATHVF